MPRPRVEKERRGELVAAAIHEIGARGSLDVTVGQIARRAGVSPALAHHYFGTKEAIFLSAMRHILDAYGAEVRSALAPAQTPSARLEAIVRGSLAPSNFQPEVVGAWLMFYTAARTVPEAARLLRVYRRRLASNLTHALRPLVGDRAPDAAETLAALIDGLYIRQGLDRDTADPTAAAARVLDVADRLLEPAR